MGEPRSLVMGTDNPPATEREERRRVEEIVATVEKHLPDFSRAVREAEKNGVRLIMHQDAFAAGYDEDELVLLGMFIKYAGLRGVSLSVHGRNGETHTNDREDSRAVRERDTWGDPVYVPPPGDGM